MSELSADELDKRPFKGKGAAEWFSKAKRDYLKITAEMVYLCEESKRLIGSSWYVYLHYRQQTSQQFLMWRSYSMTDKGHVHLKWDKVEPHLDSVSAARAKWYREANDRMRLLNAQEQAARNAFKLAQALLGEVPAVGSTNKVRVTGT